MCPFTCAYCIDAFDMLLELLMFLRISALDPGLILQSFLADITIAPVSSEHTFVYQSSI